MSSFNVGRGRSNHRSGGGRGPPKSNYSQSPPTSSHPRFQICRNFSSTGTCPRGDSCGFAHVLKMHASVGASDKNPDPKPGYGSYHQGARGGAGRIKDRCKVTSVAVWDASGVIKLFTGSHDGKWRLWATAAGEKGVTLTKEFEHFVGGPVDTVHIASHFFFCGFEASPVEAPESKAGMVHIWNLNSAQDPPMEFCISPMSKYAGSGRIRSLWTTADGRVWSGGADGIIRQWVFDPNGGQGGKGGFTLVRKMDGHLGAVTGLALVGGVMWSGGMDGTLRLWNVDSGDNCHLIPCVKKDSAPNGVQQAGHSGAITGLLPFEAPNNAGSFVISSSFDETVKVWATSNGECVASETHGQGVTAISLSSDLKGNPLLLCGLFNGDIMIRGTISNPPLCLLSKISYNFLNAGHEFGPVNDIQSGPENTFYAVADDGKLTVWQITGDFGLQ